jgi:DNA-binding CsgD family transcriptional regulator
MSYVTVRTRGAEARRPANRPPYAARPLAPRPAPQPAIGRSARHYHHPALNPHEARIALLVAEGLSNRRIGDLLGVSTRAVEYQLTSVYRKLRISGRDRRDRLAHALGQAGDGRPVGGRPVDDGR